jgi:hypothetical protein
MKTFKNFSKQIDESVSVVPKAKGEADFVAAHKVEITDIRGSTVIDNLSQKISIIDNQIA